VVVKSSEHQLEIIDTHNVLHEIPSDYIVFENSHGAANRIHFILGHKTLFNKLNRIEVIQNSAFRPWWN
jgi:hypothetical protein